MSTQKQLAEAISQLAMWETILERVYSGDLFDEATLKIAELKKTIKKLECKLKSDAGIEFDSI